MVCRSRAPLVALTFALGACGTDPTPPGTLTLSIDAVPSATTAIPLTVAGQVQRTPVAPDVPIIVSVSLGANVFSDTAAPTGAFGFTVNLTANTENTLTLRAVDATGSEAAPVELTVLHDAVGPTIASTTPANVTTGVTPDATVSITASEPVDAAFLNGIALQRGGIPLGGTIDRSADGRTLTLTPTPGLAPGAAYRLEVAGLRDTLGNLQPGGFRSCFVTAPAAETVTLPDGVGDTLSAGNPAGITAPDLITLALTTSDSVLDGILEFAAPLVHQPGSVSSLVGILDFDVDQDSTTGVPTFKDVALNGLLPSSGTRAEYMIGLFPFAPIGDSAFAGLKTDTLAVSVTWAFVPVPCGTMYGFSIPLGALGSDLDFNLVAYLSVGTPDGLIDDAAPDAGHYAVSLAPWRAPPPGAARLAAPARPGAPLPRSGWRLGWR